MACRPGAAGGARTLLCVGSCLWAERRAACRCRAQARSMRLDICLERQPASRARLRHAMRRGLGCVKKGRCPDTSRHPQPRQAQLGRGYLWALIQLGAGGVLGRVVAEVLGSGVDVGSGGSAGLLLLLRLLLLVGASATSSARSAGRGRQGRPPRANWRRDARIAAMTWYCIGRRGHGE
jgi:hypothetical protein